VKKSEKKWEKVGKSEKSEKIQNKKSRDAFVLKMEGEKKSEKSKKKVKKSKKKWEKVKKSEKK
jgi:hypothetical protein